VNWTSFSDFIHMGGHGYYVWSAYTALTVAVIYEIFSLRARRRRICQRLLREARAMKSTLEI
jgi:heme exporter protein D